MINTAIANSNLYNGRNLNPIPLQAFADDIVTVHADPTVIQLMFESAERLMYSSGLDVKEIIGTKENVKLNRIFMLKVTV